MRTLDVAYRINFASPVHLGTGIGFAKVVDDLICRAGPAVGGEVRLPYIPGSSIKGKTRSRCEALARSLNLPFCEKGHRACKSRLCILCRLFGSVYTPGRLSFSDALLGASWRHLARPETNQRAKTIHDPFLLSSVRAGNKLERATRTVEQNFLFSLEHAADKLQFEGGIRGWVDDRVFPGIDLALPVEVWVLLVGLQLVDKLGGGRSRGLGRCHITISRLVIDRGENLAADLPALLAREESLLGVSEYEAAS